MPTQESTLDQYRNRESESTHTAYEEYVRTDHRRFEMLPKGWEVRKLKQISDIFPSNVDKKEDDDERTIHLCNYTDVYNNPQITSNLDFMQATAKESEIQKFKLEEGDVIITKDSESWDDIGVPSYVAETMDGVICGYHLAHLKPYDSFINGKYLYYFLESEVGAHHFHIEANGVTRYGIATNGIKEAPVTVPSPEEQEAIVSFLDKETKNIDNLIKKKEELISLIEERRQAVIKNAVLRGLDSAVSMKDSGVEWVGKVPEHWDVPRIRFVARMESGHTPSKSEDEYWDGDIPWVSLAIRL